MSEDIKTKIKTEVRGKMICLMMDIGSRYNKSILGVSIAYMYNGKIAVRTIAMHVLQFSSTAENIYKIVRKYLADYGIDINQVISVTTDNGKNMIKAISLLDAAYQNASDEADTIDGDEHIDPDIFDDEYYDDLLLQVRDLFPGALHTGIIHGVSCAAHCIHLVVTNAINETPPTQALINKSRILAKKLRTPTLRAKMKIDGWNMATIDVVTRWNSIFTMVTYCINNLLCKKRSTYILGIFDALYWIYCWYICCSSLDMILVYQKNLTVLITKANSISF